MLCSVIEHGYDAISFSNCTNQINLAHNFGEGEAKSRGTGVKLI